MTIEEQIKEYLVSDPELSALINGRVHPLILPEKPTLPAVTFRGRAKQNVYTFDGPRPNYDKELEFSAWSTDYFKAKTVAEKLEKALHACPGLIASIQQVQVQGNEDEYFPDVKFYQAAMQVTISAVK